MFLCPWPNQDVWWCRVVPTQQRLTGPTQQPRSVERNGRPLAVRAPHRSQVTVGVPLILHHWFCFPRIRCRGIPSNWILLSPFAQSYYPGPDPLVNSHANVICWDNSEVCITSPVGSTGPFAGRSFGEWTQDFSSDKDTHLNPRFVPVMTQIKRIVVRPIWTRRVLDERN